MAQDAVQGLETKIPSSPFSFHPVEKKHALEIVMEVPDTALETELRKEPLTVVTKGRVTDIVPESDGFDQVLVKPEESSDGSRGFGDQLHVEDAVGDVVVSD
jgi:hypothetical protein